MLKATYAPNLDIVLSCTHSKVLIFNLLCIATNPRVEKQEPGAGVQGGRLGPPGGVKGLTVFNQFEAQKVSFPGINSQIHTL